VNSLPSSRKKAKFRLSEVKPISSVDERTLIIKSKDRDYCIDCYILIGVLSNEENVDYNIAIESTDINFKNSLFLKIGEP
jgi:hypothetical protein